MRHRFVEGALQEFISAGRYYNRQKPGLGDVFVDEVERGIEAILKNPHTWKIVRQDIRRYLIKRFPYGIYYTVEDDLVVIWAVKHLHRAQDYWQTRRES